MSLSHAASCASRIDFGVRFTLMPPVDCSFCRSVEYWFIASAVVRRARRLDAMFEDRLQVRIEAVEAVLVEHELERLARLVVGAEHVVLGHVLRAEAAVRGRIVELERVDDAAVHGRHDFAAREAA